MSADSPQLRAQTRGGACGGSGGQDPSAMGAGTQPLAAVGRAAGQKQRRIAAALLAFLPAPAPAVKAAAPPKADPLLDISFDGAPQPASSRAEGYARQVRQLRELQAHPHRLAERFARAAAPLMAVAPDVSLAMQAKAKTALDFLLQQAPPQPAGWAADFPATDSDAASTPAAKAPVAHASAVPSPTAQTQTAQTPAAAAARPPSDAELARWGRYVQAVQDPLSALEGLAEGRVPAEAAQTLRTVYPALYGEMQRRLFQALTEHLAGGQTLSVPQRRALSRLLGVPVDGLTAPDFGRMLQQSFAQERAQMRQPPRPAPRRAGQGGRHPITLQTPVQRIENR